MLLGQIATLNDVVVHYNNAPAAPGWTHGTETVETQLAAFPRTLNGGTAVR